MAILVDTNVVLDWVLKRQPFHQVATRIIGCCMSGDVKGYLAAHSVLNVFYITRKDFCTAQRQNLSKLLCSRFQIVGISQQMILDALSVANFKDLEDALQMKCAAIEGLDYIITRDPKGFETSKVQAVSPEAFLEMFEGLAGNHSHLEN